MSTSFEQIADVASDLIPTGSQSQGTGHPPLQPFPGMPTAQQLSLSSSSVTTPASQTMIATPEKLIGLLCGDSGTQDLLDEVRQNPAYREPVPQPWQETVLGQLLRGDGSASRDEQREEWLIMKLGNARSLQPNSTTAMEEVVRLLICCRPEGLTVEDREVLVDSYLREIMGYPAYAIRVGIQHCLRDYNGKDVVPISEVIKCVRAHSSRWRKLFGEIE